jgi:hypothetical protein
MRAGYFLGSIRPSRQRRHSGPLSGKIAGSATTTAARRRSRSHRAQARQPPVGISCPASPAV